MSCPFGFQSTSGPCPHPLPPHHGHGDGGGSTGTVPPSPHPVVISGAGLAGCMLALLLAQQYERSGSTQKIVILEGRHDWRKKQREDDEGGRFQNAIKRSINLALSYRGICALRAAGLEQYIDLSSACSAESSSSNSSVGDSSKLIIPMKGRLMHDLQSKIHFQQYGTGDQAIYSISREELNAMLVSALDVLGNDRVEIQYESKVTSVDANGMVEYSHNNQKLTMQSLFCVGADGAFSKVRDSLRRHSLCDFSMSYIPVGYKELTFPPHAIDEQHSDFCMKPWQGLHIWPRQELLLIALPNPDRTFTGTLFFPWHGPYSIESTKSEEEIKHLFKRFFPDVPALIPNLVQEFQASPTSALLTVRCSTYNSGDKILLIGDAAHGIVPFFGQGMNAAFEDCLIIQELMQQYGNDHKKVLEEFSNQRVKAGQALADLSLDNYIEMREKIASRVFIFKKKVDALLHRLMPTCWIPLYTMVSFTRIPYDQAQQRARKQDKILKYVAYGIAIATVSLTALYLKSKLQSRSSVRCVDCNAVVVTNNLNEIQAESQELLTHFSSFRSVSNTVQKTWNYLANKFSSQ